LILFITIFIEEVEGDNDIYTYIQFYMFIFIYKDDKEAGEVEVDDDLEEMGRKESKKTIATWHAYGTDTYVYLYIIYMYLYMYMYI
jgi:hypothetical protein